MGSALITRTAQGRDGDAGVHQEQVPRRDRSHQAGVDHLAPAGDDHVDPAVGVHGAHLGHPALVGARHAHLLGALRIGHEEARMLEDDVGQLPQQVVQENHVARA